MISKYFIWNAALQYQTLSLYVFASPSQKYADPIVTWDVNVIMTASNFYISSLPSGIFRGANWNFIYGFWGEVGQSAWKISQILWPFLPCLHYKKIIRNIIINLIMKKTKYISIYISRDQADEPNFLENKYSVLEIFILKIRKNRYYKI